MPNTAAEFNAGVFNWFQCTAELENLDYLGKSAILSYGLELAGHFNSLKIGKCCPQAAIKTHINPPKTNPPNDHVF